MEQDGVVSHVENRALTPDEIGLLASLITDEPDHYTVLGVDRDASCAEIESAYCLAVEYFHPLKSRKITESDGVMHWKLSSAFTRIEQAFAVLSRRSKTRLDDDAVSIEPVQSAQHPELQPSPESHQSLPIERPGAGSVQTEAPGSRRRERRRVERDRLELPLRVSFGGHWQELTETIDVSPLSIRFRLSRAVEPGAKLRIEVPMPKHLRKHSYGDDVYVVSAFVIYVANHESGQQVVAEFV